MTDDQESSLPVHRLVNWRVSSRTYRGDVACGAEDTQPHHTMNAAVTCTECIDQAPGLRMLGKLEEVLENIEGLPLPEETKETLRRCTRRDKLVHKSPEPSPHLRRLMTAACCASAPGSQIMETSCSVPDRQ